MSMKSASALFAYLQAALYDLCLTFIDFILCIKIVFTLPKLSLLTLFNPPFAGKEGFYYNSDGMFT